MGAEQYIAQFGAEMAGLREKVPSWSIAGYAIGVWGGLVAGILLLMRKKTALPVYWLSLAGAVVSWLWYIFNAEARAVFGGSDWGFMVFILAICLFAIWWTRRHIARGFLR